MGSSKYARKIGYLGLLSSKFEIETEYFSFAGQFLYYMESEHH